MKATKVRGIPGIISKNEESFILETLREHPCRRIDGRRIHDVRSLKISFGNERGLAEVSLGTTRVIAKVSCEMVEPFPDRPTEGFFHFNVEFSPMGDPGFERDGRPSEFAVELGRVVERGLRESKAIDTEALCVIAGQKVWAVRTDIHIVDNGGNLTDCASIATITALLHFRRPATTIVGSTVTVHSIEDREPVSLSIHHIPIAITFAFFDEGEIIVVDPNLKEELIMDGRITITLNSHREICALQKAGGIPVEMDKIIECARIAAVKVEEITEIIQSSLKQNKEATQKRKREEMKGILAPLPPVILPEKEIEKKLPVEIEPDTNMKDLDENIEEEDIKHVHKEIKKTRLEEDKHENIEMDSEEEVTVTLFESDLAKVDKQLASKSVRTTTSQKESVSTKPSKPVSEENEPTDLTAALKKKPKKKKKKEIQIESFNVTQEENKGAMSKKR